MVYRSPIPHRVKLDALALCSQGYSNKHSSNVFGISKRAIQRSRKKLRVHGDIEGGRRKHGRKPKFDDTMVNVLSLYDVANSVVVSKASVCKSDSLFDGALQCL